MLWLHCFLTDNFVKHVHGYFDWNFVCNIMNISGPMLSNFLIPRLTFRIFCFQGLKYHRMNPKVLIHNIFQKYRILKTLYFHENGGI